MHSPFSLVVEHPLRKGKVARSTRVVGKEYFFMATYVISRIFCHYVYHILGYLADFSVLIMLERYYECLLPIEKLVGSCGIACPAMTNKIIAFLQIENIRFESQPHIELLCQIAINQLHVALF